MASASSFSSSTTRMRTGGNVPAREETSPKPPSPPRLPLSRTRIGPSGLYAVLHRGLVIWDAEPPAEEHLHDRSADGRPEPGAGCRAPRTDPVRGQEGHRGPGPHGGAPADLPAGPGPCAAR